ncbi:MAG: ExeM/NucH family extracellular endonuclease [Acidimicrobiales bacterium]|nr:ExeM/NucH family extracellular endonuclease [Acidimicrobiales bacterium]
MTRSRQALGSLLITALGASVASVGAAPVAVATPALGTIRARVAIKLTISVDDGSLVRPKTGVTGKIPVRIRLSKVSDKLVLVDYETSDGTAKDGVDYTHDKSGVGIPPGQTEVSTFVDVTGRTGQTTDKAFTVDLSNPRNALMGDGHAVLTIKANAAPGPTPSQRYVRALGVDFAGQAPPAAEIERLAKRLDDGTLTRQALATISATSDPWRGHYIARYYHDTLGRAPDTRGGGHWLTRLRNGATTTQVQAGFYASPEYFDGLGHSNITTWLRDLYVKLLGRHPDVSGLRYWSVMAHQQGRTRAVTSFLNLIEPRRARAERVVQDLLGRIATPAERKALGAAYAHGDDIKVSAGFAAGTTYFDAVQTR